MYHGHPVFLYPIRSSYWQAQHRGPQQGQQEASQQRFSRTQLRPTGQRIGKRSPCGRSGRTPSILELSPQPCQSSRWHFSRMRSNGIQQCSDFAISSRSALLSDLSHSDPGVRQAATNALASLPIDRVATRKRVEERLKAYQPLGSKQFEASPTIDAFLFALQQLTGEV